MSKIVVTDLSRAVARTGLLPATAHYFIDYIRTHSKDLTKLVPKSRAASYGMPQEEKEQMEPTNIAFVLIHLCFTSPEFGGGGMQARRTIPYQLGDRRESAKAERLSELLAVRPWDRDVLAVNATDLALSWIAGVALVDLESQFERLRAGVLRDMYRTLVGHLTGLADIVDGVLVTSDANKLGAEYSWVAKERGTLSRIMRRARQIARSIVFGVPEDVLWLAELADSNGRPLCRRSEVVACHRLQLRTLEQIVDPGRKTVLIEALKEAQSNPERWKEIRSGAVGYRLERTERRKTSQARRLGKECEGTVNDYYARRGIAFEKVLENCLRQLNLRIVARDDDTKKGASFPDFVFEVVGRSVVMECKSSEGESDISLGEASEVFRKAGVHNFNTEPLVTVCHPYVATDVARKIEASDRLTVVNSEDLGEALVKLHLKRVDHSRFHNWLTTPGQARLEELV